VVLPNRLGLIPLSQVRLDQRSVRTLPERLAGDRCQTGLDRFCESRLRRQSLAERLERVETQLAEPLPFDQHPVVVPARKELTSEELTGEPGLLVSHRAVEHTMRELDRFANVHVHTWSE